MRDALRLMERVAKTILLLAYRWLWYEPVNARGPLWTVLFWFAVASGLTLGLQAPLAFLVYLGSRWLMERVGKPKLPARPVFRR